jgi:hypothetical protein
MERLLGGAGDKGISREEIGAVMSNVMVVSAGSRKHKADEVMEKRLKKG